NKWALVNTCTLVRTHKLMKLMSNKVTLYFLAVNDLNAAQQDFICRYAFNDTIIFRNDTYTRILRSFMLHTCTYKRSFRYKQWYSLTLHVRSHKRTVGVIILKERN